jgi:hypothetical protein
MSCGGGETFFTTNKGDLIAARPSPRYNGKGKIQFSTTSAVTFFSEGPKQTWESGRILAGVILQLPVCHSKIHHMA